MTAAITCTSCHRPLRVPEGVLGRTVQCPLCLDEFTAQADPAAEAAARAAEPPRRAAPRPEPAAVAFQAGAEPPPLPEEPAWVEPVAEAVPTTKTGREQAPARALVFPVLVTRDPDRILRGRMDAELTAAGLYLRQPRQPAAFAAVGGKTRYLGANRLVVTVEGREVELAVVKPRTSVHHLARDVAAFLGGKGGFPESRVYVIPWYLYTLPVLFAALPAAAIPFGLITDGCLGGFLWVAVALALAGVTLIVALQPRLRPRVRLITAGGLLGAAALLYLIAIPLTPRYTVEASQWRTYLPADGSFRVLMPGAPIATRVVGVNGAASGDKYATDLDSPEVRFAVYVTPTPANNMGFNPSPRTVGWQTVSDVQSRLNQEFSNRIGFMTETDENQYGGGQPYHEMFGKIYSNYGNYGSDAESGKSLAARIYVVNGKTYTLVALGRRVQLNGADVVKFFNSFQATATNPAVPPVGKPPAVPNAPTSPAGMNGLLVYWSFDRDQFGPFTDESGNKEVGTPHRTAIVPDGARGSAMHFNGPGSYFDFGAADNLSFQAFSDFTLCGWVRTRMDRGVVLSNRADLDASPILDVVIDKGVLSIEVRKDDNEFNEPARVRGKAVNDGAWRHFAVTRRFGNAVALYIDGALQGEQQNANAAGAITTDLRALGAELYWKKPNVNRLNADFTGDIDEFCVFSRALDAAEIRKLAGVGGP